MKPSQYITLARRTVVAFFEDSSMRMSAALSYYALLSMAPLVLIALTAADKGWNRADASAALLDQVEQYMGPAAGDVVKTILDNAKDAALGYSAGVFGLVTTLIASTVVFLSLQDAVNAIWRVEARKGRRVWSFFRKRLISLAMMLSVGVLLLASVLITTALSTLQVFLSFEWTEKLHVWQTINFCVSLLVISALFGAIFRYLPDVKVHWRDVLPGAAITGLLFTIGKMLLGLYLSQSNLGQAYGAAGSIVVFLVWVYYSSVILLAGAEMTRVYTFMTRPDVQPHDDAVWSAHHEKHLWERQG